MEWPGRSTEPSPTGALLPEGHQRDRCQCLRCLALRVWELASDSVLKIFGDQHDRLLRCRIGWVNLSLECAAIEIGATQN